MESRATSRKRTRRNSTSFKPSMYCSDTDVDEPTSYLQINEPTLPSPRHVDEATSTSPNDVDKPTSSLAIDLRESGFVDATMAGGHMSKNCTLILTEGLSAKSFVMTCLSHVGSEIYGVYPLRGKIKNVRNVKVIVDNVLDTDSRNIAAALGIQAGLDYADIVSKLRYGHVLIMTDQDCDGIHIKGLLMNLFHHVWPLLLEVEGFLQDFTTTLIKAKHKQTNQECFFKSLEEHKKWEVSQNPSNLNNWTMKYYKGLASHSDKEAIQYFKNIKDHLRVFIPCGDDEEKQQLNRWMKIAFCKNSSDLRKQWLKTELKDGHGPDYSEKSITILNFIQKELILYFKEDLQRSIPSLMDGFKPSQRKVMFYLCEKESTDQKVCHLSGKVSEAAAYHHGDTVLEEVIIRMAQDFAGSNNINLLEPNGQFGSRRKGGHDHGGARYIGTELAPISRLLFLEADDNLVMHRREDGKWVEPEWYAPIAPLVLINGAMGIGTGYSTTVPSYKPTDVIENLRMLIDSKPIKQMVPWYRDFEGEVVPVENHKGTYIVHAKWELHDTKLKVDDLPPGVWYDKYEKTLAAKKRNRKIKDYKRITKGGKDRFEIDLIENLERSKVEKMFKLSKKVSTTNLVLLDAKGHVKHYDSIEAVLEAFFRARLEIYIQRKVKLVEERKAELDNAKCEEQRAILRQRIRDLQGIPSTTLWKHDLERLEAALNLLYNEETCTTNMGPDTGLACILKNRLKL